MPVNLLDLPVELLDQIVRWVALLRYEYSESRRPKPSALHHLAYGTNRLLRSLALPYLGRLASTNEASTTLLLADGLLIDSRRYVTVVTHKDGDERLLFDLQDDFGDLFPMVKRVVLSLPPYQPGQGGSKDSVELPGMSEHPSTNAIESLEIRRGGPHGAVHRLVPLLTWARHSFPAATTLRLVHCTNIKLWTSLVKKISGVTRLEVALPESMLEDDLKDFKMGDEAWSRLRHFALAVAPPLRDQAEPSLKLKLDGFKLPPSSPLTSLTLSTQLPTRFTSPPHRIADVLPSIISSFGTAALTSFSLDEYASCEPTDLATLAAAFPTLQKLSLGDRMIWKGSRADLLNSLASLSSLHLLSCRILPDLPGSSFRNLSADGEEEEAQEEEEYASPASIALEAAAILPRLSRVGFSGRQSTMEWFVVSRTKEGKPERAEAVELYSLDLDRL